MRRSGQPDWPAIKRAYERGDATVQHICDVHGISRTTLYRRARRHRWARRGRRPDAAAAATSPPADPERRCETIARLYEILDGKMRVIEARSQGQDAGRAGSSAESERDARTLSALVRIFEKLTVLEDKARDAAAASADTATTPDQGKGAMSDAERLRGDLAHRLARLCETGPAR